MTSKVNRLLNKEIVLIVREVEKVGRVMEIRLFLVSSNIKSCVY